MDEFRPPDFRQPPPERPEGHVGYVLLAAIVTLLVWWSSGR